MIFGYRRKAGRLYVLAGLSAENIERLMTGEPIQVSQDTHGAACPEELVLQIVAGQTEDEIHATLVKAGIIRPGKTESHDHRKEKAEA
jgi:hypothetical protein